MPERYSFLREIPDLHFYWVNHHQMAASSSPYIMKHFKKLQAYGIKVIIDLRLYSEYDVDPDLLKDFSYYHIPIIDGDVPSINQVKRFWQIYQKHKKLQEPIVVHCIAGCGRTGTIIAIWLMLEKQAKNSVEAISMLRKIRQCSVEYASQENFIATITQEIQEEIRSSYTI